VSLSWRRVAPGSARPAARRARTVIGPSRYPSARSPRARSPPGSPPALPRLSLGSASDGVTGRRRRPRGLGAAPPRVRSHDLDCFVLNRTGAPVDPMHRVDARGCPSGRPSNLPGVADRGIRRAGRASPAAPPRSVTTC